MAFECITVRQDGAVAHVTLNRPAVRNAFNEQLIANGASNTALRVTRADAECGLLVARTGSGAATGQLAAAGGEIRVGSTSDSDVEVTRNSTARITVTTDTVVLASLPTSSAGLPSGGLWRDAAASNVVKIVP